MAAHEQELFSENMRMCQKLERVKTKLIVGNTEVMWLNDVNENIELGTFVKVCVEMLKDFNEGNIVHYNLEMAMRKWEEMQKIAIEKYDDKDEEAPANKSTFGGIRW